MPTLPSFPPLKLPTIAQDRSAAFLAYARACVDYAANGGRIRGREAHVDMIAIGAAESGLDNMAPGRNDLNGTAEDRVVAVVDNAGKTHVVHLHYSLGLGWLQHDSGWLEADRIKNGVDWSIERIRQNPMSGLWLVENRPGLILYQGIDRTYVDLSRWNVWPRKSDQFVREAANAYDTVIVGV